MNMRNYSTLHLDINQVKEQRFYWCSAFHKIKTNNGTQHATQITKVWSNMNPTINRENSDDPKGYVDHASIAAPAVLPIVTNLISQIQCPVMMKKKGHGTATTTHVTYL